MWNNSGRNTRLDQAKFTDIDLLNRDSTFNVAAQGVRKGLNSLVGLLAEIWTKS